MSTKIKTLIITLVASASFGVATVAPAVSQAKPVKPGNTVSDICNKLYKDHEVAVANAKAAQKAGKPGRAKEYAEEAARITDFGQVENCAWAVIMERAGTEEATRPPVGGATEGTPPVTTTTTTPVVSKSVPVSSLGLG
jgi:hypothetical protein